MDLDRALDLEGLRAGLLEYTRQAYGMIAVQGGPRVLDLGCGTGLPTIELARLSGGQVIALDVDAAALAGLARRLTSVRLAGRVLPVRCSALATCLRSASIDLVWDEGTLHLLEPTHALTECARLLKPEGHLVLGETVAWLERHRGMLAPRGLKVREILRLPSGCWWTEYYAPLKRRLADLRAVDEHVPDRRRLRQLTREVAMVEADPARFDCGYLIATKAG